MALLVVGSWVAGGTRATTPPTTAALAPFIASTQAPKRNAKDGAPLIYIPAGKFLMGSREGEAPAEPDEKPQREVYLDGYWIYKYEVSVAQYRKFCCFIKTDGLQGHGFRDNARVSGHDAIDISPYLYLVRAQCCADDARRVV